MKKDNEFNLANIIWNHWQNGTLIDDITVIDDIAPKDRTHGYEVQKYFNEFSNKDIFGWKIAASNKAGQEHIGAQSPLAGVLLEEKKIIIMKVLNYYQIKC